MTILDLNSKTKEGIYLVEHQGFIFPLHMKTFEI